MTMPEPPETPAASVRWLLWATLVLVLCASFIISFAANAPARWVTQSLELTLAEDAVSGTLMNGQIALDGGFVLRWTMDPVASILGLKISADLALDGTATDLRGPVTADLAAYRAGPFDGRFDVTVLQAIFPSATLQCAGPGLAAAFRIELTRQGMTGAGTLRTDVLDCKSAGQTLAVPALSLGFAPASTGSVMQIKAGAVPVLTATSANDGRLAVVLHKEGAALFPGLPSSADSSIELPLSTFFH